MRIQQSIKNRITVNHPTEQSIKPGQIVRGNILKLFSNGRAEIQLGSQNLIAQLQAPLKIGQQYHFQIQQIDDDVIHLKVITEVTENTRSNLENILRHFGIKPTRLETNFMQALIKDNIPFQQSQFKSAINIINQASDKQQAQHILKQMIHSNIPINKHIFNALYITELASFSEVYNRFNQTYKNSQNTQIQQIKQLLQGLQTNDRILSSQFSDTPAVTKILQSLGIKVDNSTRSLLKNYEQGKILIKPSAIENVIEHLIKNKQLLQKEANVIIKRWGLSSIKTPNLKSDEFLNIKNEINEKVTSLLAKEQVNSVMKMVENNPNNISRLVNFLTTLSDEFTYQSLNELRSSMNYEFPKQQMLFHLKQMPQILGLSYENLVANDLISSEQLPVKGLLIQMINELEGISREQAQQLLHLINGLQIQSVQESQHFIQANIVLLEEAFGMHNDIDLQFESRKTPDGKIDPDYCRILFYLDLAYLRETVIDMHIQNRLVSISVFNKAPKMLAKVANKFKPKLTAGLKSLQYDLTNITFERLQSEKQPHKELYVQSASSLEGIDYRI